MKQVDISSNQQCAPTRGGFPHILSQGMVVLHRSVYLPRRLPQVAPFSLFGWHTAQNLGDGSEFLVALESTPVERFTTVSVHYVADGCPNLSF